MANVNSPEHRDQLQGTRSFRSSVVRELTTFLLLIVWPFIYFWPYLISYGLTPGNDFHTLYYRFKLYLVDLLSRGLSPPVWSPTEAAGFPFRANPFTASWYPLNSALPYFYRANGGYSEWDHVVFTLVAFPIFALGITVWLRVLGEKRSGAILAALVFATSVKMSELLRFPNAAHSAAWIPWLLVGTTLCFRRRRWALGAAICFVASYFLLTAGYPYFAYYSQFLVGLWIVLLICPATRRSVTLLPDNAWNNLLVSLSSIAVGCGAALICCLSYLREMKLMLAATTDRQGGDWGYGTAHDWNAVDVLGSLIYPPRACTEGWYFFGVSALVLMGLFAWEQLTDRSENSLNQRRFLMVIAGLWIIITLITLGESSPLFYVLWKFYPGFSSLRVWSRMNITLLPVLALLLARSWNWWIEQMTIVDEQQRLRFSRRLITIAFLIVCTQLLLVFFAPPEIYWLNYFQSSIAPLATWRPWLNWSVIVLSVAGLVPLVILCRRWQIPRWKSERFGTAGLLMLVICSLETCGYGWLQWANSSTDFQTHREVVDIPARLQEGFSRPRVLTMSTVSLGSRAQLGILSNWYYQSYIQFLRKYVPHPDNLAGDVEQFRTVPGLLEMLGAENGQRVFLVPRLDYATPQEFVTAAREFRKKNQCRLELQIFHGDHLRLTAATSEPGFLCYIDNWDPIWTCTVNGRLVPVEVLMGTFKAVSLTSGVSEIYFSCTDENPPGEDLTGKPVIHIISNKH